MQSRWPKWKPVKIDEKSQEISSARRELKEKNMISPFAQTKRDTLTASTTQFIINRLTSRTCDGLTIDLSQMVIEGAAMVGILSALADDLGPEKVSLILREAKITHMACMVLARFIEKGKFKPNLLIDFSISGLYNLDHGLAQRMDDRFLHIHRVNSYINFSLIHQKKAPPWHLKISSFVLWKLISEKNFYEIITHNSSLRSIQLIEDDQALAVPTCFSNFISLSGALYKNPYLVELIVPDAFMMDKKDERAALRSSMKKIVDRNLSFGKIPNLMFNSLNKLLPLALIEIINDYFWDDRAAFPMVDLCVRTFNDSKIQIDERADLFYSTYQRYSEIFPLHQGFETLQNTLQKNIAFVTTWVKSRRYDSELLAWTVNNNDKEIFNISKDKNDNEYSSATKKTEEDILTLLQWSHCQTIIDAEVPLQQENLMIGDIVYIKSGRLREKPLKIFCDFLSQNAPDHLVILIESHVIYQETIDAFAGLIKESRYPKGLHFAILGMSIRTINSGLLFDALIPSLDHKSVGPELHLYVHNIQDEKKAIPLSSLIAFNKNLATLVLTDVIDTGELLNLAHALAINDSLTLFKMFPCFFGRPSYSKKVAYFSKRNHTWQLEGPSTTKKNFVKPIINDFKRTVEPSAFNDDGLKQFWRIIARDIDYLYYLFSSENNFVNFFRLHEVRFFTWLAHYYHNEFRTILNTCYPREGPFFYQVDFVKKMTLIVKLTNWAVADRDALFEDKPFASAILKLFDNDPTKVENLKHRLPMMEPIIVPQAISPHTATISVIDDLKSLPITTTSDKKIDTEIEDILTEDEGHDLGPFGPICFPHCITLRKKQLLVQALASENKSIYRVKVQAMYHANEVSIDCAFKLLALDHGAPDKEIPIADFHAALAKYEQRSGTGKGRFRHLFNSRTKTIHHLTQLYAQALETKGTHIKQSQVELCLVERDIRGQSLLTWLFRKGIVTHSLSFFRKGTLSATEQKQLSSQGKKLSATERALSDLSAEFRKVH